MRTPPPELSDEFVLTLVQENWPFEVASAEHLPWGFGAWHWAALDAHGTPRWFVTADRLGHSGRLAELERAYAAAAALSASLPVVAPLPTRDGRTCCEAAGFAVSVTSWIEGSRPPHGDLDDASAVVTAGFAARLHEAVVPDSLGVWDPDYPSHRVLDDLAEIVATPWGSGPHADHAQRLVRSHLDEVERWRERYAACAAHAVAHRDDWVVTHGEPGPHNQVLTPAGRRWVDWESARLAPRERDLYDVVARKSRDWERAYSRALDPVNLELFDLAWRLDEIGQYTEWFRKQHTGTDDDRIALDGLRDELSRADRPLPSGLHLDRP